MKSQDEKNIRWKGIFYGMVLYFIRWKRNVLENLKNSRRSKRKYHQNLWICHNVPVGGLYNNAMFVTLDGRLKGLRQADDCCFVELILHHKKLERLKALSHRGVYYLKTICIESQRSTEHDFVSTRFDVNPIESQSHHHYLSSSIVSSEIHAIWEDADNSIDNW